MRIANITRIAVAAIAVLALAGNAPAQMHDHGSHTAAPATNSEPARETQTFAVPDAFTAGIDSLLTPYFTLQAALSRDSLDEAKKSAAQVKIALYKVNMHLLGGDAHEQWMTRAGAVLKSTDTVAAAGDLKKARAAFRTMSDALILVIREFGTSGARPVYVLHCPMAFGNKGADWLQDKAGTANPYLGKSMFACGTVTETLGSE